MCCGLDSLEFQQYFAQVSFIFMRKRGHEKLRMFMLNWLYGPITRMFKVPSNSVRHWVQPENTSMKKPYNPETYITV